MSERVLRSASQRQLTEAVTSGTKRIQDTDDFLEGLPPAKAIADNASTTSESSVDSPSSTKSVIPPCLFDDYSDSDIYCSPQKTADLGVAGQGMDQQVVTTMLELKSMFQGMLDETLDRKLLGFLEPKIAAFKEELSASLNAQLVLNLEAAKCRMNVAEDRVHKLEMKIHPLEVEMAAMKQKLEVRENKARRDNLIFSGVAFEEGENCFDIVRQLCEKYLGLSEVYVNRAHRLKADDNGRRDIIANFVYDSDVRDILSNAAKFAKTGFFVKKHLVGDMARKDAILDRLKMKIKRLKVGTVVKRGVDAVYVEGYKFFLRGHMGHRSLWSIDPNGRGRDGVAELGEWLERDFQPIWMEVINPRLNKNWKGRGEQHRVDNRPNANDSGSVANGSVANPVNVANPVAFNGTSAHGGQEGGLMYSQVVQGVPGQNGE